MPLAAPRMVVNARIASINPSYHIANILVRSRSLIPIEQGAGVYPERPISMKANSNRPSRPRALELAATVEQQRDGSVIDQFNQHVLLELSRRNCGPLLFDFCDEVPIELLGRF